MTRHKNFEDEIKYPIKEDDENISITISDLQNQHTYSFIRTPRKGLIDGDISYLYLGKGRELKNQNFYVGTVLSGPDLPRPVYKFKISLFRNGIKDFEKYFECPTDFIHNLIMFKITLKFNC